MARIPFLDSRVGGSEVPVKEVLDDEMTAKDDSHGSVVAFHD
jgi:hypothetical protein